MRSERCRGDGGRAPGRPGPVRRGEEEAEAEAKAEPEPEAEAAAGGFLPGQRRRSELGPRSPGAAAAAAGG